MAQTEADWCYNYVSVYVLDYLLAYDITIMHYMIT